MLPLGVGSRRAADRLTELRDWSIGLFAQGDPFGPNLGSFRGRTARHKQDLLKRVEIETRTLLESTRTQALRLEKPDQSAVRLHLITTITTGRIKI